MLFDVDIYLLTVIIVILIGVVLGLRRILQLEEKVTYLLDMIKDEEETIDKKVSSTHFKAAKDKIYLKKKILGKMKKK